MGLADVFCKGLDSKYHTLCGSCDLCYSYSTLKTTRNNLQTNEYCRVPIKLYLQNQAAGPDLAHVPSVPLPDAIPFFCSPHHIHPPLGSSPPAEPSGLFCRQLIRELSALPATSHHNLLLLPPSPLHFRTPFLLHPNSDTDSSSPSPTPNAHT